MLGAADLRRLQSRKQSSQRPRAQHGASSSAIGNVTADSKVSGRWQTIFREKSDSAPLAIYKFRSTGPTHTRQEE